MLTGLSRSTLKHITARPECSCPTGLGRFDHVMPSLIQLHWLPVSYRIKFKLCCLMHAIHHLSDGNGLLYYLQQNTLRASVILLLIDGLISTMATHRVRRECVPAYRSFQLERTFDNIRAVADSAKFRKLLNSHYFSVAFLANVNVLRYVCYMLSAVRLSVCLSVCCLSVCCL